MNLQTTFIKAIPNKGIVRVLFSYFLMLESYLTNLNSFENVELY